MAKDIHAAVRELCLSFPESEEYSSHGSPNFRVRGKTFATYVVNHHGDGRVALWLNAPDGAQEHLVRGGSKSFFVPPYVGPRGWVGMSLDQGLSWNRIAALVREAYEKVAPAALAARIGRTIEIEAPAAKLSAVELDPIKAPAVQRVLQPLRKRLSAWPETSEGGSFGFPVWRAGKKTFACAWVTDQRLKLSFWVGVERQGLYTADPRFSIPPYMGHNGWIALDVSKRCD
jgi:predicted DNA-binding protein (MmcQ/YjbR family)